MNNTTRTTLALCVLTLTGCATLKPLVEQTIEDLKPAIADLGVEGMAKDALCDLYVDGGKARAEEVWAHDWPFFAHLFEGPPDPTADLQWAREQIVDLGAIIITKPEGRSSASAACFVVAFPFDFEGRTIEEQAAVTIHELGHLVGQKREGCKSWLANYAFASMRTWEEAMQYALKDALLEHYGVAPAKIARQQRRRVEKFPVKYKTETVGSACVERIFTGVRKALRDRAGV